VAFVLALPCVSQHTPASVAVGSKALGSPSATKFAPCSPYLGAELHRRRVREIHAEVDVDREVAVRHRHVRERDRPDHAALASCIEQREADVIGPVRRPAAVGERAAVGPWRALRRAGDEGQDDQRDEAMSTHEVVLHSKPLEKMVPSAAQEALAAAALASAPASSRASSV
jgi:hypothetical protein